MRIYCRGDYPPSQVKLKLTESMLAENIESTIANMQSLRLLDARLAHSPFATHLVGECESTGAFWDLMLGPRFASPFIFCRRIQWYSRHSPITHQAFL